MSSPDIQSRYQKEGGRSWIQNSEPGDLVGFPLFCPRALVDLDRNYFKTLRDGGRSITEDGDGEDEIRSAFKHKFASLF